MQTPEPGVFIEKYAVIKQSSDKSMALTSSKPIGWLRTMIEWDKTFEAHQWAGDCGGDTIRNVLLSVC